MNQKNSRRYRIGRLVVAILPIILIIYIIRFQEIRPTSVCADEETHLTAEQASSENLDSSRLLAATIHRVSRLTSISAEMNLTLYLFGETYSGTGQYEELMTPLRVRGEEDVLSETSQFRLYVKMPPPDAAALAQGCKDNLLETVCDRNSLWTYTSIEGQQRLTEVNLNELAGFINQMTDADRQTLKTEGLALPCGMSGFPGLGGIAGMLSALVGWYDFAPEPETVYFNDGTFPAWKISGTMKPEKLELLKKNLLGSQPNENQPLLEHLPVHVEISIGKKKPFPYRIEYFFPMDSATALRQSVMTVHFTRVFEDVSSVVPGHFVYLPKINSERITKQYLSKLVPGIEL